MALSCQITRGCMMGEYNSRDVTAKGIVPPGKLHPWVRTAGENKMRNNGAQSRPESHTRKTYAAEDIPQITRGYEEWQFTYNGDYSK